MRVFRIYNDGRLPNDAMGAKIAGGRWNPKGYMVLYAATHLSLACLEKVVHLERGRMPRKVRYAWADLPANIGTLDPNQEYVRQGRGVTSEIGKQWIVHGNELAVRVPSSLIPDEDNVLLNPVHLHYGALQWDSRSFEWDSRLLEMIGAAQ
jgi:RES domain-containing protein